MATGDVIAATVRADGFSIDVTIEGWAGSTPNWNFGSMPGDASAATITLSLSSSGYSAVATATAVARTTYVSDVARVPGTTGDDIADSGSDLTVRLMLSDFIFSSDTSVTISFAAGWANNGADAGAITDLAVTNSSAEAYPLPVAQWLTHDSDIVYDAAAEPRLAVAHKYGRSQKPVAGVRFSATDGVTTVTSDINAMSWTTYSASGMTAPYFEAALDFSALDAGVVDVDAIIYPWVGEAFQISVSASAWPSINLCPLRLINDYNNGYGIAYAYVDSTATGSGTVSATAATAEADPFTTIPAAASALQTFINTTYGRNNASGGIIRLAAETFVHSDFSSVAVGDAPLIIEAANAANIATTIYRGPATSNTDGIPDKLKFRNVTIQKGADSNVIFLDSVAALGGSNMLVTENCVWGANGTTNTYAAWIYRVGRVYDINSSGDNLGRWGAFGTVMKEVNMIGCAGGFSSGVYHAAGCYATDEGFTYQLAATNREAKIGTFFGWNQLGESSDRVISHEGVVGARGLAYVGSVIEQTTNVTQPAIFINADNNLNETENVLLIALTLAGGRANLAYQDVGSTTVNKRLNTQMSAINSWNCKDDLFPTIDAARYGNWSVRWHVGDNHNAYLRGSGGGDVFGDNQWVGQVPGIGDITGDDANPIVADWASDASFTGTDAGGGDYTPGAAHELPTFSTDLLHYPVDLYGNVAGSGTATAGAVSVTVGGEGVSVSPGALQQLGRQYGAVSAATFGGVLQ